MVQTQQSQFQHPGALLSALLMSSIISLMPLTYADELHSSPHKDHSFHGVAHPELLSDCSDGLRLCNTPQSDGSYSADFFGVQQWLTGRQEEDEGDVILNNNEPRMLDLDPGDKALFQFPPQSSAGMRWITLNICSQPTAEVSSRAEPPQPDVYVDFGPERPAEGRADTLSVNNGFANYTTTAQTTIYIGVSAPSLDEELSGRWQIEVAASTDRPYHVWHSDSEDPVGTVLDTDFGSALFISKNLSDSSAAGTQGRTSLYTVFTIPANSTALNGLKHSHCAFRTLANLTRVQTSGDIRSRGRDGKLRQQVYVNGLNASTEYHGFWASNSSGSALGGGEIWAGNETMSFTTKKDGNCQLIFDLPFCTNVAYAVPSNGSLESTALGNVYDVHAQEFYSGFNYSLQQIPCNTTATQQYSLAKSCTDCAADYKNWLCAIMMPRCADLSNVTEVLQPRNTASKFLNGTSFAPDNLFFDQSLLEQNASNSSRQKFIDEEIRPGPYKELQPCEDLCYSLVRSCPASFGFGCPDQRLARKSYGQAGNCNDPATAMSFPKSAASHLDAHTYLLSAYVATIVALRFFW